VGKLNNKGLGVSQKDMTRYEWGKTPGTVYGGLEEASPLLTARGEMDAKTFVSKQARDFYESEAG